MFLGIATRKELLENTRVLLVANGQDFDAMVNKARTAGNAKRTEASNLRQLHANLTAAAQQARDEKVQAAADVLQSAMSANGTDVMEATVLRKGAADLLASAKYFTGRHPFSRLPKHLNIFLVFIGEDLSVFTRMQEAANEKEQEALELEAAAAEALADANTANADATTAAEAAFKQAVEDAAPNLVKAADLEKAAQALVRSADFFTL